MISFGMSEEQELIRDAMREFAADAIRPIARECDEAGEIPADFLKTVWTLGLTNTQIPEEYGGAGEERALVTNAILLEELAFGDASLAIAALDSLRCKYLVTNDNHRRVVSNQSIFDCEVSDGIFGILISAEVVHF